MNLSFSRKLKTYMIINFRIYKINQGMYKLTRTSILIKKKIISHGKYLASYLVA